jgi:hypothetical protein
MLTLSELCVRQVAHSIELLGTHSCASHWLGALPSGALDEIVRQLVALGRWRELPWAAVRLLIAGAPLALDFGAEGTVVEDAALRTMLSAGAARASLRSLRASSWISDETVATLLRRLTALRALDVRGCALLRLAVAPAPAHAGRAEPLSDSLVELDVSGSAVADTAMRRLLGCLPSLRVLRANHCARLTPSAFVTAARAPPLALRRLELRACAGFVGAPAHLARRCPQLEHLDLSSPRLAHAARAGAPLSEALGVWAPWLRVLRLRGAALDPSDFVPALPALEQLDLAGCTRADEIVASLRAPCLSALAAGGGEAALSGARTLRALVAAGARVGRLRRLELHAADGALDLLLLATTDRADASDAPLDAPRPPAGSPLALLLAQLEQLTLVDCGQLSDGVAAALADACPALRTLRLLRARQRSPSLDARGAGARRLLARIRRLTLHLPADEPAGLALELPCAERLQLQLAAGCALRALVAPHCASLLVFDAAAGTADAVDTVAADSPSAARTGGAEPASKRARGGAPQHAALVELDTPRLTRLALLRCEPAAAVELALGALRGSRGVRRLCLHDCALGEAHLRRLGKPLAGAAMRSLLACRISGSRPPVLTEGLRELLAGASRGACHVARQPSACTSDAYRGVRYHDLAEPSEDSDSEGSLG